MPSEHFVRDHFAKLQEGNNEAFYSHVADTAIFKVTGSGNPLHGTYTSKAEFFTKYQGSLAERSTHINRNVTNIIVMGEYVIVEFTALGFGKTIGNYEVEVLWLCKYRNDEIVEITMYMDSATVKKAFEDNSLAS